MCEFLARYDYAREPSYVTDDTVQRLILIADVLKDFYPRANYLIATHVGNILNLLREAGLEFHSYEEAAASADPTVRPFLLRCFPPLEPSDRLALQRVRLEINAELM
jgi:hypothetical protein